MITVVYKVAAMIRANTRTIALLLILLTIFTIYAVYTGQRHGRYIRNPLLKCDHSKLELDQLVNMTYNIRNILTELQLDHWLMYGSVLGALRVRGPLPWDDDVDIGVRWEQFMIIKTKVFQVLRSKGYVIHDFTNLNSVFKIVQPGSALCVEIFVFYDYDGIMKRPGWLSWLLFIHYELHQSFPTRLVKPPLPQAKFGFFNITVPRGGIEIAKYLYRFDWWKEVKPELCRQ